MAMRPTTVSIVTQPDVLARAKSQLVDILDPSEGDPSNRPSLVVVAEKQMLVAIQAPEDLLGILRSTQAKVA
jgi:hypothetical protein